LTGIELLSKCAKERVVFVSLINPVAGRLRGNVATISMKGNGKRYPQECCHSPDLLSMDNPLAGWYAFSLLRMVLWNLKNIINVLL
jgi:hypothetical protein